MALMKQGLLFSTIVLFALPLCLPVAAQQEDETEASFLTERDIFETQQKTVELIKLLVDEGIITQSKAREMLEKASSSAAEKYGAATEVVPASEKDQPLPDEPDIVRVPYVPEYIRKQIRDEIKKELADDVSKDIIEKASKERWGVPGAWPTWIERMQWSGDFRLRDQYDQFSEDNANQFVDIAEINAAGGAIPAGQNVFLNSTEDRNRLRIRLRLGMTAEINETSQIVTRLATGNRNNPVSNNHTLGDSFSSADFSLDRAYYKFASSNKKWQVQAGRMQNPWLSTDLLWDNDLNFDGVWTSYRPIQSASRAAGSFDPFISLGAFPIEEFELNSQDKWLYGFQFGFAYGGKDDSDNQLKLAIAYYDYRNIVGKINEPNSTLNDFTAPDFVQKGNTFFNINTSGGQLAALASDYDIANITVTYDIPTGAAKRVSLVADFVKNLGFDQDEILQRTGEIIDEQSEGFLLKASFGWSQVAQRHAWRASITYRSLERDAVVDAYTDSNFHLGGTNAEGYILSGQYGLADNSWLMLRLLSSDEIDGAPFGIDTWQLDYNLQF